MSQGRADGFEFGDDSPDEEERLIQQKEEEFRGIIQETFEPWMKSKQADDHPDTNLAPNNVPNRHNDGRNIYRTLELPPLWKWLRDAAKAGHSLGEHPKALPHFLTHIQQWEKWEIGDDEPVFEGIPIEREKFLYWLAGHDKDDPEERAEAKAKRTKMLRPGGTGMIIHGEQGTTKTTAMYWLVTLIMQINQLENIVWQSTLDDTEWQIFGPWATMCLPEGIDVRVEANPYGREYRDVGAFEIEPEDICRQVIRYRDPETLLRTMANRHPGQIYVVYPDPRFRNCQALTGWEYENLWEVDSSDEATDTNHFWFGLMEALHQTAAYNYWTTLVGDEAHKWLRQGKGNDEHDWWNKIDDWATYWGDSRKQRLSVLLAIHKWHELHSKVRDKVRWGATMNGEDFPDPAPVSGKNTYDQDLGDMCVWNNLDWNHVGYPDLKRHFSVPADISVTYPEFEALKRQKS